MADPPVLRFVQSFLNEVMPTVTAVPGVDLPTYCTSLVDRFSNPHIKDTLLRLAEDGSQKLQTTMRPVLLEKVASGESFDTMALAIGGWIRFMTGVDESGVTIFGMKDPQGGTRLIELATLVVASPNEKTVRPFLLEFLGEEVGRSDAVVEAIAQAVITINQEGTRPLLARRYA